MAAYYNEIDPYAAQWLRNLIAAGHIAPGEVDERSIVDVQHDDLRGYTQCHFFAGLKPLVARLSPGMGSVCTGEDSPFRLITDPKTGKSIGQEPWRIGMLRGYGNAINPWVAAEFIRASE